MQTLSTDALDTVTGGTPSAQPTTPTGGTSSGSGCHNNQILSTLQNIEGSIKELGNNNNNLFGGSNGAMLMMTMAFAMSRQNQVVVYGGGRHWGWHCW